MSKKQILFLAIGAVLIFSATASSGEWIKDSRNNCHIWNPDPEPDEEVVWSGQCFESYATGYGTATWYKNGKIVVTISSFKHEGRSIGEQEVTYPDGDKFVGYLDDWGRPTGLGKLFRKNGGYYLGNFNDGRLAGFAQFVRLDGTIIEDDFDGPLPKSVKLAQSMGRSFVQQENFRAAEKSFVEALENMKQIFGVDDNILSPLLFELGGIYLKLGKLDEALKLNEWALRLAQSEKDSDLLFTVFNNLGILHLEAENFSQAREYLNQALKLEQFIDEKDRDSAIYLNLSILESEELNYSKAEELIQQSLLIEEKLSGSESAATANILDFYARLLSKMKRYEESVNIYQKAIHLIEKTQPHRRVKLAGLFNNISTALDDLKKYEEAESFLRKALQINLDVLGESHRDVSLNMANLAVNLDYQKKFEEAFYFHSQALELSIRNNEKRKLILATRYHNLAFNLKNQNNFEVAKSNYMHALEIKRQLLPPTHPSFLNTIAEIIDCFYKTNELDKALDLIQEYQSPEFQRPLFIDVVNDAKNAGILTNDRSFNLSFELIQRAMKTSLTDTANKVERRLIQKDEPLSKLIRRQQNIEFELNKLSTLYVKDIAIGNDISQNKRDLDIKYERLHREKIDISHELEVSFPNYAASFLTSNLTLEEARSSLSDENALLIYFFGKKSYAWLVSNESSEFIELDINKDQLFQEVQLIRASLDINTNKPFAAKNAYELYGKLIKPLETILDKKKNIFLLTNGAASMLPFQLLISRNPSDQSVRDYDWLIKKWSFVTLPSVSMLKLQNKIEIGNAPHPMIAFGNPIFQNQKQANKNFFASASRSRPQKSIDEFYRDNQFNFEDLFASLPQLSGTAREIESIAKKIGARPEDIYLGPAATETNVKASNLDRYRIIYFATHGLVAGDLQRYFKSNIEPALVLSKPKLATEDDDGLLMMSEIAGLDINANWVILSACNTASGSSQEAEALSGLANAFLFAGAKSLLVSHWEINDMTASRILPMLFMEENFALSNGERLRSAILSYLRQTKDLKFHHPKYWAPFVVIGESRM